MIHQIVLIRSLFVEIQISPVWSRKPKIFLSCSPYIEFCLGTAKPHNGGRWARANVRSPLPLSSASKYRRRIHWKCFVPVMRLFALIDPRRETYSRLDPISLLRVKRHIDFLTFCIQPTWRIGMLSAVRIKDQIKAWTHIDAHVNIYANVSKHCKCVSEKILIYSLAACGAEKNPNIFPFTNCHKTVGDCSAIKGTVHSKLKFPLFTPMSEGGLVTFYDSHNRSWVSQKEKKNPANGRLLMKNIACVVSSKCPEEATVHFVSKRWS